jgi:CRISPR/Cas system-associated exonuclease Cas4 (RecB family)
VKSKISTIADLAKYTAGEIEEVRRGINLRGLYYMGVKQLGSQTGLTLAEYEAWKAKPATDTCRSCHGTGLYKKPERSVGTIHASSAHACVRRLFYDVDASRPPKQDIRPELQITFAMGHGIHDVVQRALHVALPGKFQDEIKVDLPEAFILGSHTDGLAEVPRARVLLEIKSIGSEFDKLTKPKSEHITQACAIYAKALRAPFISFLYVSKQWPHNVKEFVVVYDETHFQRWWKQKGSLVEAALESGIPPVADAGKEECQSCPYAYFCPQKI